jgi:hypothetical protein
VIATILIRRNINNENLNYRGSRVYRLQLGFEINEAWT